VIISGGILRERPLAREKKERAQDFNVKTTKPFWSHEFRWDYSIELYFEECAV
jgi:hypothetical protein